MLQVTLIDQNLAAQDNILAALTDAYAQTANVRKGVEEILKRREHTISSLITSYDAYEDLLAKSSKGLEFYRKLEINISKLLQRVRSTCKVQEEEREHILAQDSKNYQEKVEAMAPAAHDHQARNRTGSGLKLKDYLNNRPEAVQNQYYNVYKGQGRSVQMDATAKSYASDGAEKSAVYSVGIAGSETVSAAKPVQQYYPTSYADYKTNLPYTYDAYNENPGVNSVLSQGYMQVNSSDAASTYQQMPATDAAVNPTNTAVQYPVNSFMPNGQFPAALDAQHNYSSSSQQPQYNLPANTLQYETYQPPVDYTGYSVTQRYPSNLENTGGIVKADVRELPAEMPTVGQTPVPASSAGSKTVDAQSQHYTNVNQQAQQYMPEPQQKLVSQESAQSQHVLPTDNSQMQNYTLPQMIQNDGPACQSYDGRMYYNLPDLQSAPGANNNAASTPYMQTQYMNANIPQPGHSASQLPASANEMRGSYSPNLHGFSVAQYSQQSCPEQSKQLYADKAYSYGSQVPINDAALSYPSTYQSAQLGTGVEYPQTMMSTESCNTYTYTNCPTNTEIIQSHAKSLTAQNYSQAYQYPQYSGYVNYPQATYNQGYNYVQGNQMANAVTEPYNGQMEYTYNPTSQCYEYNSGNLQTPQTLQEPQQPPAPTSQTNASVSNGYSQQESNARYTNASNNSTVSQTPSSQYSGQPYQSQSSTDIYYTTPYGLQMQNASEYNRAFTSVMSPVFSRFNSR